MDNVLNKNSSNLIYWIFLFILFTMPLYYPTFFGAKICDILIFVFVLLSLKTIKLRNELLLLFLFFVIELIRAYIFLYSNSYKLGLILYNFSSFQKPYVWQIFVLVQLTFLTLALLSIFELKINHKLSNQIIKAFLSLGIIELILSIYQKFYLHYGFPLGTFTEKGPLSSYSVSMIMFIDILFLKKKIKVRDYLIMSLIYIFLIFFSIGARGIILLIAWKIFFYALSVKRNIFLRIISIILIVSAFLFFFQYFINYSFSKIDIYLSYANNLNNLSYRNSLMGRYAALEIFKETFKLKPLFGFGFENYPFLRSSYQYAWGMITGFRDYSNNIFIQMLIDNGIIGTFIILFLFLYFYLSLIKKIFIERSLKIRLSIAFLMYLFLLANVSVINDYIFWETLFLYIIALKIISYPSSDLLKQNER